MHLVDLFLSAFEFAPYWIAKGSMRSISMTIAHPAAQVAGCQEALRAITVGAEYARSRVLAGPRDSGRHFVSKCSHCACSVSHERGPNARSYVKSPPPPPAVEDWPLYRVDPYSGFFSSWNDACGENSILWIVARWTVRDELSRGEKSFNERSWHLWCRSLASNVA